MDYNKIMCYGITLHYYNNVLHYYNNQNQKIIRINFIPHAIYTSWCGISKQHSQVPIHLCSTSRITSRNGILDLNEFWSYKDILQLPYLVNVAQKIIFLKLKLGVFLQSSSMSGHLQKYLYELFAALE